MAYQTTRTLAQLKAECDKLGIEAQMSNGKKFSKSDYVEALRGYYLEKDYNNNPPKGLELMLNIESPMLCQRLQVLKPEEQKAIWESKDWYLEEKMDGARLLPVYTKEGGFDFYSRNISVSDFLPISYRDNIYTEEVDTLKITDEFILDSEVVSTNPYISTVIGKRGIVTETQLQAVTALLSLNSEQSIEIQKKEAPLKFYVFDILWLNGEWQMDKTLKERRKIMIRCAKQLKEAGLNVALPPANISNKEQFYRALLFNGKEGCIAKNIHSNYTPNSSRGRKHWVKIKRSMSESSKMEGLKEEIDAFITGYEEADENKSWAGYVGAIEVSVFLQDEEGKVNSKPHMIARISGLSMEQRKEMTDTVNGRPVLKPEFYGKVVEIDGQAVSARAKRLKHAVLVRWRPDRSPDTCIVDEGFLNSMIL